MSVGCKSGWSPLRKMLTDQGFNTNVCISTDKRCVRSYNESSSLGWKTCGAGFTHLVSPKSYLLSGLCLEHRSPPHIVTERMDDRILGMNPCRVVSKQSSIREYIPGSPEETEDRVRREACFWNLQSRGSIRIYDFWFKTIKLAYLKEKKKSLS